MMNNPSSGDEIARITLVMYGDGEMGISGNVGDVKFALDMLDQAREAVMSQLGSRITTQPKGVILPSSAVGVQQDLETYPVEYAADRPGFGKPGFNYGDDMR